MEIGYTDETLEDIAYWKKHGDKEIQKKIQSLIEDIKKNLLKELANLTL